MAKWPPDVSKFRRVSTRELREMFNQSGLDQRVTSGEVAEVVLSSNHPSAPLADEPFCTKSQMVELRETTTSTLLATFHRYLRVDGNIGASGLRDPKALRVGDVVFIAEDRPGHH
jgi:hypothetical protein